MEGELFQKDGLIAVMSTIQPKCGFRMANMQSRDETELADY